MMAAATEGDLLSELLTYGAAECGAVDVAAYREADGVRVRGHSAGGLVLEGGAPETKTGRRATKAPYPSTPMCYTCKFYTQKRNAIISVCYRLGR